MSTYIIVNKRLIQPKTTLLHLALFDQLEDGAVYLARAHTLHLDVARRCKHMLALLRAVDTRVEVRATVPADHKDRLT